MRTEKETVVKMCAFEAVRIFQQKFRKHRS